MLCESRTSDGPTAPPSLYYSRAPNTRAACTAAVLVPNTRLRLNFRRVPKIILQPGRIELNAPRKANLLQFLQESRVPVGSACGGKGLCASCKLRVLQGGKNLSRPNDTESELAERNHLPVDERISCQSKILGDVELTASYWHADQWKDVKKT